MNRGFTAKYIEANIMEIETFGSFSEIEENRISWKVR